MPAHDRTRVRDGLSHYFRSSWTLASKRAFFFLLLVLVSLIGPILPNNGQEQRPASGGAVELTLRDPEGRLLVNVGVEILPSARNALGDQQTSIETKTDAKGVARFSWPAGVHHLRVAARGIGHGATGTIEVLPDHTARPRMPPLMPYGAIAGRVPPDARKPGTIVFVRDAETDKETRSACDEEGHFLLKDMVCGAYWVRLQVDGKRAPLEARVWIGPGRRGRAEFVRTEEETGNTVGLEPPDRTRDKPEEVVWAAGKVRDEQGRPVEGADVHALATFHGGIRMYERILSARTDKEGHWSIKGPGGLSMFGGSLLVHKKGHPPVSRPLLEPGAAEKCEVVLPTRGGRLEVRVLQDGKARPDAAVQLSATLGPQLYHAIYVGAAHGQPREEVEKFLYPSAATDAEGIARFEDLAPGLYEITAAVGDVGAVREVREGVWFRPKRPRGSARGIAVRRNETTSFSLAIYPQPNLVQLRLLQPDGKPWAAADSSFGWGTIEDGRRTTGVTLDRDGVVARAFDHPGLWAVSLRYRLSPVRGFPISQTPYFEAVGFVAASPLLPVEPAVALTVARREPGSLVVQLRDAEGKAARGFVVVDRFFRHPAFAGSSDEHGVVRFDGVQAGEHEIEAHLAKDALPDLDAADLSALKDEQLIGRSAFFTRTIETVNDGETRVEVRPARVGYVRGVVHVPPGRRGADYEFAWNNVRDKPTFTIRYDPSSGQFALGPFPEGTATVDLLRRLPNAPWRACGSRKVEIRADRVAHVEFRPPAEVKPESKPDEAPQALLGMDGLQMFGRGPRAIGGRVLLPDGETPAQAARLVVFEPERRQIRHSGQTDARGRIEWQPSSWYRNDGRPTDRPGDPSGTVVVAWLPGSHGAILTPFKPDAAKELKIVLPPELRIRGKVTVGGKAVSARSNQLRILAAHEGNGNLDGLMSLDVNPAADGSFELAGLSAGTYRVQAAMDGIWLSQSVRLTVASEPAKLGPLALDIGEPGTASVLELVRRDGGPARGSATVVRPDGPLAALLWPATFPADGAGLIHLPPLEVGTHNVRIEGGAEQTLRIPPRTDPEAKPVRLRIVRE